MMAAPQNPIFLRIPPEIRILIYEHLLDTGGNKCITIRNQSRRKGPSEKNLERRRSHYHVLERSFARPAYETTYTLEGGHSMHPAILCTNRKIREEASHWLYARHGFHFGEDLEAVVPFLCDRTPVTRDLIRNITLHKRSPTNCIEADSCEWRAICRFMGSLNKLEKLKLVVEGGRPLRPWDGPQALSVSDFHLLYSTRHESLEWARELAHVKTIGEVEIVAEYQYLPEPKTNTTLIFAAFSASIETTLVDFLKELGIPARVTDKGRRMSRDEYLEEPADSGCVAS